MYDDKRLHRTAFPHELCGDVPACDDDSPERGCGKRHCARCL